jgi:rhodanese-related sulfurtransferase
LEAGQQSLRDNGSDARASRDREFRLHNYDCLLHTASDVPTSMDIPLEVDVTTAAQLLRDGALLLDVREAFEVEAAAIAGSRHIPMRQVPENLSDLPHDRLILVLCHVGARSLRVTQFLRANGFGQASNVAGGIDAWAEQIDPSLPRY